MTKWHVTTPCTVQLPAHKYKDPALLSNFSSFFILLSVPSARLIPPSTMVLSIFGNNTKVAHWQPEPGGRGTSSLLQTCLITLGLCVYSAVHLNIPQHGVSGGRKFFTKLKWLTIALFAPELIVFVAWTQRCDAATILKFLTEAHRGKTQPPLYRRMLQWLRLHKPGSDGSTEAVSHGFAFDQFLCCITR